MLRDPMPYSVFAVDMQNYSARDALGQLELRRVLRELLQVASDEAGISRDVWERQDSGDGEVALVPPNVPKGRLAADFIRELLIAVNQVNVPRRDEDRVRLRVALHFGDAYVDGTGYAGPAVIEACRLLDSKPLRLALDAVPEANLVLGLSDRVYQDVVRQRDLHPRDFQAATVEHKTFAGRIWVKVPGGAGPNLLEGGLRPQASPVDGQGPDSEAAGSAPADADRGGLGKGTRQAAGARHGDFRRATVSGVVSFGDGPVAGGDINQRER
jgi:hypothetical protein